MPRRIALTSLLATTLLLGAVAVDARAQDLTRDRVQVALDITDRRIELATVAVNGSNDDRAHLELGAAVDLQGRAKSAFSGAQYEITMTLTLQARSHADRAVAIVKGLPDPDRVQAQLERTRDMLERARDRIEECGKDRARALISTALAMQARAEDAAAAGRYLAALQLSMSARERGLRALRICDLGENRQDAAEHALRRTDDVIQRAQDAVADHGSDPARDALARAQRAEDQAWGEFRANRFDAALGLTQAARALAYRSLRMAGRGA